MAQKDDRANAPLKVWRRAGDPAVPVLAGGDQTESPASVSSRQRSYLVASTTRTPSPSSPSWPTRLVSRIAPPTVSSLTAPWSNGRVRQEEYDQAVGMGKTNVDAIELMRRHCRHGRIELVSGNSPVGAALGLPMGLTEVRCEHAAPSGRQAHQAMDLAIEFYNENCVGCPYREGTGELPNLATVATRLAEEESERRAEAERRAAELARRHDERERRRRDAVSRESDVVRELTKHVDRLDRAEPRIGPMSAEAQQSARHVLETARAAPTLFSPVLVDTLLELAADTADSTALIALAELVRGGRCRARRALEAALAALQRFRSIEAGDLMAMLGTELVPSDLPDVLNQVINLASGDVYEHWRPPAAPKALIATSDIYLPLVTERITEQLESDDDWTRHIAADAANVLLAVDATRIVAFGEALITSIRGPDAGYGGYPHPASAAINALATAWRREPATTRTIVESGAVGASEHLTAELSRIPWMLRRFREPWDAGDGATTEALEFLVRRAGGDWGDEAADHAVDTLERMAGEVAGVADHVDSLVGHLLALCSPEPASVIDTPMDPMPRQIAAMERQSRLIRRDARRRDLAKSIGLSARFDPTRILGSVLPLFTASTGDETYDRAVRTAMIDSLEEAVSAETLRDLLPIVYSALLNGDAVVRSGGIDLWVKCARVAETLPDDLNDLAPALLADSYVVVHRKMLSQLPYLHLPGRLAPPLLQLVAAWLVAYKDTDPGVMEDAIWSLRSLASMIDDGENSIAWHGVALLYVPHCRPHGRERLLAAPWPDELRNHNAWVTAALETAASPDLVDYYNQRSEPLLAALMDGPSLIAHNPLAEVSQLSDVHDPRFVWRAMEPVDLLQSAGRWADAVEIARHVEERQLPGTEGEAGRRFSTCFVRGAELVRLLVDDGPDADAVRAAADALRDAVAELEGSRDDVADDSALRHALDSMVAQASAAELLHVTIVNDPTAMADELERSADVLSETAQPAHASGRQRQWLVEAWRIAALLLRHDAAVRSADLGAGPILDAARRRAEILSQTIEGEEEMPVTPGLSDFLEATATVSGASDADAAWRQLGAAAAPICIVGTGLLPRRGLFSDSSHGSVENSEPPLAVCVPTLSEVPVTDVLVVRPDELYTVGMMVRLIDAPEWAETCIVEPITSLGREALTLPRYVFSLADGDADDSGITLIGEDHLQCRVQQPIRDPAVDCPIQVRLIGDGHDEVIEVAGCTRIRLRPFDQSRDFVTQHHQTNERLLTMFGRLDSAEFTTQDVRAFCRVFASCVRAAQRIMFTKRFMRSGYVSEGLFHDEMEQLMRDDPELEGRLSRRDAVAGGFDDLLHDDIIVELKVERQAPATVERSSKYIGQPTQYGVGRGSQLSVLVVLDHTRKTSPPGVIENYVGWMQPRLHGLDDPAYPSLVGVLIINTNLPVPSAWSRRQIETVPDTFGR